MPWINESLPGSDIIVPPSGTGASGIMFFGEAAGETERRERRPFVERGQAGSVLHRAFRHLGMERNDYTLTNTVWWQPPNNYLDGAPWQGACMAHCREWNLKLIAERKPRVLVALGKIAYHELTGLNEIEIAQGRGFVVPAREEYGRLPVVATFHPSFIIRGSKRRNEEAGGAKTEKDSGGGWGFYDIMLRDLALARLILQQGQPSQDRVADSPDCNLYGQRQDWEEVIRLAKANPSWPISYDFETPLSVTVTDETEFEQAMGNITQFQVSLRPGHALVSSWDPTLFPLIKTLLELPNPKLDWNGRGFDRKILRDLGVRVDNTYRDVMWMWHHVYRDWPMGLQFATSFVSPTDGPWKHTFHDDLRRYGSRDVHEPHKIYEYCQARLKDRACPGGRDLLSGYERQILLYQNVVFHPLQVRGIPINNERREKLDTVLERIETQVTSEIQPMVPESVKPVKQADGLKDLPKEWKDELKARAVGNVDLLIDAINSGDKHVTVYDYTGEPCLLPIWNQDEGQELMYVGPNMLVPKATKTDSVPKVKVTKALKDKWVKSQVAQWTENIANSDIDRWVSPSGDVYVRRLLGKEEGKVLSPDDPSPFAHLVHELTPKQRIIKARPGNLRWAQLEDFNPNSAPQKLAYIAHKQVEEVTALMETRAKYYKSEEDAFAKLSKLTKYKIPLDFKTKRPTTGKKEIDRLIDRTSDDVLTKCREVTEVTKLRGTYIGKMTPAGPTGWCPHPDGKVHPFYHDGPATGQGASRDPNSLNFPKHLTRKLKQPDVEYLGLRWDPANPLTLGKAIRSMICAPLGHRIVAADYRAFHVLTTGYEANDPKYMRLARLDMHSFFAATRLVKVYDSTELLRMSDKDLTECLDALKKDKTPRYHIAGFQDLQPFKLVRDKLAKPCIAEGQLVLTNEGLVPIEAIQCRHLVWDGVEWVRHSGLIYKGVKEVITYEGLTATPDHKVVCRDGQSRTLLAAKNGGHKLETTGDGGAPVRTRHGDRILTEARERILESSCQMQHVWNGKLGGLSQPHPRENQRLQSLHGSSVGVAEPDDIGKSVRCDRGEMYEVPQSEVQGLWRPGHPEQVLISGGIHRLGGDQPAASYLQESRDRQDQQRRALRTREPETIHSTRTNTEPKEYSEGFLSGENHTPEGVSVSLRLLLDTKADQTGPDRRTDLAEVPQFARVYDIADAGPRRCFTVSDSLVFNCILGYGFGLQAAHLQHENQEFIKSVAEAERLIVGLDEEFPVTCQWRRNIPGLAERQGGWLISKHGYIRHFNCLVDRFMVDSTYQPRVNRGEKLVKDKNGNWWCIAPGDDNEACIAFLPANDAFGMIREGHLRMTGYMDWYSPVQTGEDLMEKYGFVIPLHDENVWICEDSLVDQLLIDSRREMTRQSDVLRLPDGSGLWCDVEYQISPSGGSWAEMQDLKF